MTDGPKLVRIKGKIVGPDGAPATDSQVVTKKVFESVFKDKGYEITEVVQDGPEPTEREVKPEAGQYGQVVTRDSEVPPETAVPTGSLDVTTKAAVTSEGPPPAPAKATPKKTPAKKASAKKAASKRAAKK